MNSSLNIYQSADNQTIVEVKFDKDTVWLTQQQIVALFDSSKSNINEHIKHIFESGELTKEATVRNFRIVQQEGKREVTRTLLHYNLDVIVSVGYRVNSIQGTQFRIWATQRLKEYLIEGYAINEKRLEQKNQEVEYLKTGIRILGRAIESASEKPDTKMLQLFAKGLELLDDYDHETLDIKGRSSQKVTYPSEDEYLLMIKKMYSDFESDVFAQPKDESFSSSIAQIQQTFDGLELYPSLEVKAANLLYLIVKNHSFVDGNKRIAAACFLYFLDKNDRLVVDGETIISNEALATLTLFIATSKPDEHEIVKRLIVSILNRNSSK